MWLPEPDAVWRPQIFNCERQVFERCGWFLKEPHQGAECPAHQGLSLALELTTENTEQPPQANRGVLDS